MPSPKHEEYEQRGWKVTALPPDTLNDFPCDPNDPFFNGAVLRSFSYAQRLTVFSLEGSTKFERGLPVSVGRLALDSWDLDPEGWPTFDELATFGKEGNARPFSMVGLNADFPTPGQILTWLSMRVPDKADGVFYAPGGGPRPAVFASPREGPSADTVRMYVAFMDVDPQHDEINYGTLGPEDLMYKPVQGWSPPIGIQES